MAHTATAFGLDLHSEFDLPGVAPAQPGSRLPRIELAYADEGDIERAWDGEAAVRLSEERVTGDEPDRTVDFDAAAGYRLYARYFGLALVSRDGTRVVSAPPPLSPWRWQRFLVGRVIPLAALLHGYEVLHASAVAINGRAVGFAGASGAGKSSLALGLALAGAPVVADDVLSLAAEDSRVVAYPGSGVMSLRDAADPLALAAARQGVATDMGWSGKAHLVAGAAERPLALGAFYFLQPSSGQPRIEPLYPPDPRRLLSSAFIHEVRTPERLSSQLEVCSTIAQTVPLFVLDRGDEGPASTAAAVELHTRGLLQ